MPKTRIPSPSRSVGSTTPRRYKHRGSHSVNSPAPSNASGRLTAIIDQFKEQEMDSFRMSPMRTRWSVLTDNTDIEEPRRKSWWKNLNENSQDLMMVLEDNKTTDSNNSVEDISDIEILSQENRNYSLDLPESSDSESIHSIVIPQRKLFTQKENKPQKKFGQIVGARETLTKLHKSNTTFHEKSIAAGTKDLFPGSKRTKPVFSAALLNVSANKTTADKTTENVTGESKVVVKNIFGNRPAKERKNMFTDFILPDEPETSEKKSKKGTVKNVQNANEEQAQVESKKNTDISKKENSKQILNQQMSDGNEDEDQIINEQAKDNVESNKLEKETRKIVSSRETMDELHEPNKTHDDIIIASTKDLFQGSKKSKPVLSSTLLNISVNKTVADKTNINMTSEPIMPVKNIFGSRPDKKRKNIFADFVVSYSEHETSEIKTPVKEVTINKSRNINETTRSKRVNETNENKKLDTEQSERMIIEDRVNQKEDYVIESEDERIDECQEVYSEATENFKSNQPQTKIRKLVDARETMDKLHKTNISLNDDIVTAGTKDLFQGAKKSNIVFSSTLLHISPNKTVTDKAETNVLDPKILVKNIFGNRSPNKRKNIFADFIESESEHEISEIRLQEKEDSIIAMAPHTNEDQDNEAHGINEVAVQSVKGNQGKEGTNKSEEEVNQEKEEASKSLQNKTLSAEQRSEFLKKTSSRLYQEEVVSQKEVENDIEGEHGAIINDRELEKISREIESSEKKCNENVEEKENSDQSNCANGSNIVNQLEEVTAIESENDEEMNYEESDEEIQEAVRSHEEECVINKEDEDNEQGGGDNQEKMLSENDKEEDDHESENDEEMNYEESDEEILEPNRSQEQVCNENEDERINPNQKDEVDEIDEHDEIDNKEDAEHIDDIEINEHLEDNDKINEDEEDSEIENEEAENEEKDDEEMKEHLEGNDKINEDDEDNGIDNEETENEAKDDEEINKSLEVHAEGNKFDEAEEDNEIDNNDEDSDEEINEQNNSEDDKNDEDMNETDVHDEVNALSEEAEDDESESEEEMNYEESEEENPEVNRTEEDEESIDNENAEEIIENQEVHDDVNESNLEHDNESDDEEMKYEESDEEIQENVKTREDNVRDNKENEQIKQNQEVRNKFNDLKEVSAPVDSSAEGSGWDSHRVTRKTLRQTFGKEFTPRKSLRALVMEKSAKQTANAPKLHSETIMIPQANSTEFPENSNVDDDVAMESDHELSRRTRQTTLETYLEKMKQQNIEKKLKMNQAIRNSLQVPQTRDTLNLFKVPLKPAPRKLKPTSNKPKKQLKTLLFGELPSEVIEDMKYKPPKRFQPSNASWITKRLYKFLEQKLEPKYDYKARVRAEKLVETIYHFAKELRRHNVAPIDSVDVLKHELARLDIVKTHFEFYDFFHEFMPREIRVKVVPDVVNKIPLPRHGVFADILKANAVQG